jgi:hypothetical protein
VIVPVAGVVGVPVTSYVKCVESVTVIVKSPLYSVCAAPDIVTVEPDCQLTGADRVTVAIDPDRVMLLGVTVLHPG